MPAPVVPYPNATSSPATSVPTNTTPPVGTTAPEAAAPLAFPLPTQPSQVGTGSVPSQLAKEGSLEQQSAFEAAMVKMAAKAGLTGSGPGGTPTIADIWAQMQANQAAAPKAIDPTVAAGYQAYENIWGVTPPGMGTKDDYIANLVKQGFNVFQIQLHELSMPGANRTQYYRDNVASMSAHIAQIMGRR